MSEAGGILVRGGEDGRLCEVYVEGLKQAGSSGGAEAGRLLVRGGEEDGLLLRGGEEGGAHKVGVRACEAVRPMKRAVAVMARSVAGDGEGTGRRWRGRYACWRGWCA